MTMVGGAALVYSEASGGRAELQAAIDSAVLAGTSLSRTSSANERIEVARRTFDSNYGARPNNDLKLKVVTFTPVERHMPSGRIEIGLDGRAEARIRNRFSGILGGPELPFDANASARKMVSDPICVLTLNGTRPSTFDLKGDAKFTASNCATMTNSGDGEGMREFGKATAFATQFGVNGRSSGDGWSSPPIPGVDKVTDPLAALPVPPAGPCVAGVDQKLQQATVTLSPGTYCGGITVKSGSFVTLQPGVYIMKDGPLRVDSNATVEGNDVLIVYAGADSTLYVSSGAQVNVTSPRTGPYANIQMMSDRSLTASKKNEETFTVIGGGKLRFDGTIYLPEQQILISGAGKDAVVSGSSPGIIAIGDTFLIHGNAVVEFKQENLRGITFDTETRRFSYGAKLVQ